MRKGKREGDRERKGDRQRKGDRKTDVHRLLLFFYFVQNVISIFRLLLLPLPLPRLLLPVLLICIANSTRIVNIFDVQIFCVVHERKVRWRRPT